MTVVSTRFAAQFNLLATIVAGGTLLALGLCGPAGAQERGAVDLLRDGDFEQLMRDSTTRPAEWYAPQRGNESILVTDVAHTGKRSLRIRQRSSEAFAVCSQTVAAKTYRGRRIRITGQIRVEDLKDGYAGLWCRIDGDGYQIALDNMHDRGITGTADWAPVEIELDVPEDADALVVGCLFPGVGTAWFDALTLEDVGPLRVFRFERPASADADEMPTDSDEPDPLEPVEYGTTLLSDEELAVRDDTPIATEPAWAEWVRANHHPLRSLRSEDFADLAFLAPLLKDKRIVQLGENGHGVREFNHAKVRLIRYLHAELGFDVIAFESGLYECWRAGRRRMPETGPGETPGLGLMRSSIFAVWHTAEVVELFDYIAATRKTKRPLILAGFDCQLSSGRGARDRGSFLADLVEIVDPDYAATVASQDEEFTSWVQGAEKPNATQWAERYDRLARFLTTHADAIRAEPKVDHETLVVARQTAWSMARFAAAFGMQRDDGMAGYSETRDEAMARNLDVLADELYPDKKIAVWGHNFHIRHANEKTGPDQPRTMGGWAAQRRRDELYTVGLYMYSGQCATNNRRLYNVTPAARDSLEATLHRAGVRWSFVDMAGAERSAGTSWMYDEIEAKSWGTQPLRMVLRDQYDAILFVDASSAPDYR